MTIPHIGTITLVKTCGLIETPCFQHSSTIFLHSEIFKGYTTAGIEELIIDALFRLLLDIFPAFKHDMYQLIGFTVTDKDIDLSNLNIPGIYPITGRATEPCHYCTLDTHRYILADLTPMTLEEQKRYHGVYFHTYLVEIDDNLQLKTDSEGHHTALLADDCHDELSKHNIHFDGYLFHIFRLAVLGTADNEQDQHFVRLIQEYMSPGRLL